jgi:hypothetical protein
MKRSQRWLPKRWAKRVKASRWEPMSHNHSRRGLTIHNEGVDRPCTPGHVTNLAQYVVSRDIFYHAIWCPRCGQWAQIAPFTAAARSMVGGPVWNGASANKTGTVNVQVCVAGYGNRDFTDSKLKGAWVLAEIMDRCDIPWKARAVWGPKSSRNVGAWMRGGVQGHQHGPRDNHTDPNRIDVQRLFRHAKAQQKARQ